MLLSLLLLAAGQVPATLTVAPGAQATLSVPGMTRVAVGDPSVADVTAVGPAELLVVGRRAGRTTLLVWTGERVASSTIAVDDGAGDELARRVKSLVNPSLSVITTADGVTVIDGRLDSVAEQERLDALVQDEPRVKVLARLDPRVLPVVAGLITRTLKDKGLGTARATCVGQTIILEGSVADEAELRRALAIAHALYRPAINHIGRR